MRKPRPLLLTSAAVGLTAAVGVAGTDVTSRWYRRLDKPSWQPPGPVFGATWTVLYVLLAVAGARALTSSDDPSDDTTSRRGYVCAYAANLVLNAGWNWSFFRAKRPLLALAEVAVLEASTVDLARRTWRRDRRAGAMLVPYALWVTYATALTAELARRNSG